MAAMASSPAPEAPALDPKSHDSSVLDKEGKADLNGHASPALESKPELDKRPSTEKSADEPVVNGKPSPDDSATNGVTTNGDDASQEKDSADSKPTDESSTITEKPTESAPEKPSVVSEELHTAPNDQEPKEDVVMEDAADAKEPKSEEASRDEVVATSDAPEKDTKTKVDEDITMTDDKLVEKPAEKQENLAEKPKAEASDALPTSEVDLGPASMSQLAIESTSPLEASIEVSMGDAPLSAKVAREREEDFGEEPAAKRAKTEPKEDEPPAAAPVEESEAAGTPAAEEGLARINSLHRWDDAELQGMKLSPFQRREIRKIILRIKKTKHGGHFRDAVSKLWPALGESYLARIDKPMDLGEIERGLRDPSSAYTTFGDMRNDLSLIFENTLTFNGSGHDVTTSAFYAVRSVWQEAITVPEEEPAKPKSVAKPKPPREPRVLPTPETARRQSSGPVSSPPPPTPVETKPKTPVVQEAPADRRGSTAADPDRPKRTVRAPKPKDIDYTKPSRKKLKPELQFSDEVLTELMHPKNQTLNMWFLDAVDAEGLNIPDYYSIIKKPMDLGKVSRMLSAGEITSLKDFDKNVRLVFTNCYQFNGPPDQGNPVSMVAKQLEDLYVQQMKGKDAWLAKYAKANVPRASASNASDDEDEDDSEEEEASAPSVDSAKEIQELKSKLEEESSKLNLMFASGTPQALIECQKVIVETVQQALYKAAQNQTEVKPKVEKPTKKASKPSKSKAAGNPPSRKSTGNAPPPKKSGGVKKAAPKKSLSAADKDQIASAINDLEYPHLDRAIDIIKRDTGQNENNDGELELDIDQLSNEALLKLWELCKKVLPGFGKDSNVTTKAPEVNKAAPAKQASKQAAKPKKNKPMSAQEQEARIAQLTAIQQLYKPGQEPGDELPQALSPNEDESSDDSDSEEE